INASNSRMRTQRIEGCCIAKNIYNLSNVHNFMGDKYRGKKCRNVKEFFEELSKRINAKDQWEFDTTQVFLAITNDEQEQETEWLKELGFSQMYIGAGLTLSTITRTKWYKEHKLSVPKPDYNGWDYF